MHRTNVHAHHRVPYHGTYSTSNSYTNTQNKAQPTKIPLTSTNSFFNMSPESEELFEPLVPDVHSPFKVSQFLCKKLRWLTLGAQYDWTKKSYPTENIPCFPEDIAHFTQTLFPEINPEAAIVNIYSPGDTLSLHRDVSEQSDKGLVSISFGCDAIFVVGTNHEIGEHPRHLAIRLRSGDAVYMTSTARFAWHGVPRIIAHSCPDWLKSWPAMSCSDKAQDKCLDCYQDWNGWIDNKRVNLNIRQIFE